MKTSLSVILVLIFAFVSIAQTSATTPAKLAVAFFDAFESREHGVDMSRHAMNFKMRGGVVPPDAEARHQARVSSVDAEYHAKLVELAKQTVKILPASAKPEWKAKFKRAATGDLTDFNPIQAQLYLESLK